MKITKAELKKAYGINRAINRIYYEKTRLEHGSYSKRILMQKIHELENELEQFPLYLQFRVKEMTDSKDWHHDTYSECNWMKKWQKLEKLVTTNFKYEQVLDWGRKMRARQLGIDASVFDGIPY